MQAHQAIVQRSHTFVNALLMIHVFDKFFFFGRKTSDAACSGYSCGPWHLFLIRLIKMKECVVCYKSRVADKLGLTCTTGHHFTCFDCAERGQLVEVSSAGWPAWRMRCPCCRLYTYAVIDKIESLALARALIRQYQEQLREDSDTD